ncbi:MoxR family ATPase [Variovorax sp. KK3]|uniref:AAA family ATPase n=1 Tax=Variovorax sp. KK3 TaxID=1855728 RepID=UPI0009F9845E|nr:MoxR family ATPase [Variovorax sp. KK3]
MSSRHQIDLSQRFNRRARLPATRRIEATGSDSVPASRPPKAEVQREAYLASPALEEVVNLAIALGRPLLLQGDPGCGKTRLAHAVAYALGLPIEESYIKSTSKAQDLLYTYDAVRRLHDVQLPTGKGGTPRANTVADYIRFGPLGRAIVRASHGRRSVVLIDEVDKADLDFPNDLLRELDRLEFEVAESPDIAFKVPPDQPALRPIIIVTHNEEKALPTAFLRRCIFHYVEFPKDELDAILAQHSITDAALRSKAIEVVTRLRQRDLLKKPGLSELLDWVGYLQANKTPPAALDRLPAVQALIKNVADLKPAQEAFASATPPARRG